MSWVIWVVVQGRSILQLQWGAVWGDSAACSRPLAKMHIIGACVEFLYPGSSPHPVSLLPVHGGSVTSQLPGPAAMLSFPATMNWNFKPKGTISLKQLLILMFFYLFGFSATEK